MRDHIADLLDAAQQVEQEMRDAALVNRETYTASDDCLDCQEPLEPHRVPFGRCIGCAEARELKRRTRS